MKKTRSYKKMWEFQNTSYEITYLFIIVFKKLL